MEYKELIIVLSNLNSQLKEQSLRAVNTALTLRNWFFGFYIIEFEQHGEDHAQYGKSLLAKIAKELKTLAVPNSDERELRRFRQFYLAYPLFLNAMSINDPIRGLLPPEFISGKLSIPNKSKRGELNPGFKIPDTHYALLFNRISYSHFVELIRLSDPLKRLFYEMESIKNAWSVNELKRQIGSLLFERTGLSKNKKKIINIAE